MGDLRSRAEVSTFDCNIMRDAFRVMVREEHIPEGEWQEFAAQLFRDYTGYEEIEPRLLEWITRK
ncbi:hypothetical protein FJ872_28070 [Mesorhizobium sp. B2-5-9]|uniref:hypothetical protein n=1 Tax=unclassified Mesorhizobium TaxID=325217 RepID=UPI00112B865E|nr:MULTISPECIES: hypothetical protein [unclassified Mesorhizobium]MBZ9682764.1 hypothetical protein [Mesorhizobium sp. CO1-1-2]MBZ9699195.1 hypothetical protein [Mesorhizobium sp. CO1-1-9]MBZ9728034.1 hypothetical protein [Mesorhizobium sp. CO1-1-11]MBZ9927554.1 hypothetical protein [Mesorhizobium sp. BR1-1-4]MBZ9974319.1 hypothetical protein [Mesorhizobium sp. BR-1-1-10]